MRSIAYRPAAMTPSVPLVVVATLLLAALPTAAAADKTLLVDVAARPGQPFASRPTRTLADFAHVPTDPPADRFGGQAAGTRNATGFFRTERCDGRWWIIDPDGGLFLCRGVNSIAASPTAAGRQAMERLFTNEAGWARATVAMLRTAGFNCVGSWSDHAALAAIERPMPQTRLWSFMAAYGRKRGGTFMQAGHVGYPNDCPFIFDPDFPAFCAEHARQLAAEKNSPWVLGHYTDNEMPWKRTLLDGYLGLPEGDPGRDAARSWLARRRGTSSDTAITDDDRSGFLEFAIDRYLAVVTAAIRRHDPNHLVLGPRLHEICFDLPEVFRACGRHCDVVSVNYYRAWTPDPRLIAMWTRESQRPFLVTEHYAKGVDSGMGNTSGAGWLVKTQQDRGRFYQNFAIGLLESRNCVGWFWHRYADNDPLDKKVDPSNRDSNKGIVSPTYDPWTPLVDEMTAFNGRVHGIVARLDGTAPAVAMPASRPITTVTAAREGDADERPERPSQQPERKKERVVVFPDDVRVDRDVAYLGPDRRQKADLYFPPAMPANRRLPAVVVIHGGGFNDGDKDRRREINIASHLARRGYVAMSIDYRLWSKGAKNPTWPQSLHDAKTAVRWLRQNAGRLGIDPDRIGAIGCSAGGNLASMLALTGPKDGLEPPDGDAAIPTRVRCAVNLYGAVDLLKYHDMKMFLKTRAEDPDSYRRASPISYCDKDDPPLLILHGTGDETVDVSQSRTLARALETAGAPHRLIEIPDAPHTFDLDYEAFDVKTPVFDFFDEHLAR